MPAPTATPHARRPGVGLTTLLAGCALLVGACSGGGGDDAGDRDDDAQAPMTTEATPVLTTRTDPLPVVTPTPREMRWLGPDVLVSPAVTITAGDDADPAAVDVVRAVLEGAGATDVTLTGAGPDGDEVDGREINDGDGDAGAGDGDSDSDSDSDSDGDGDSNDGDGDSNDGDGDGDGEDGDGNGNGEDGNGDGARDEPGMTVVVGTVGTDAVDEALQLAGVVVPAELPAEGYALAAVEMSDGSSTVVLGGADAAGIFYAAQSMRQLTGDGAVAGVGIVDHPTMRHRGSIEGFYGSPWTTEERLDQLAFYGELKLNTYIYAPKDDPYHRAQWRDPYPADRVAGLTQLIEAAAANHVRVTFAVSPGVSICYSDPADVAALTAKLEAVHALGVRSFSIALDDIDHTVWHCDGDAATYGPPSTEAAAHAQVDLLNAVQTGFIAAHPDSDPLEMVPTEYRGTADSPYRAVLRERLDPQIEVMWTGVYVVPAEITVAQAQEAAATFGRPLYVWDNTPVNDFPPTEGRLILAPYARREVGLSAHVTGVVLNPMNQAAASKVQLVGAADFAWNDAAYDPARAHRAAADHLAAGDPRTTEALLAFFDLQNLAPTSASSGIVSQPQAPALAARLDHFRTTWSAGDRQAAIDALRPHADQIAAAPDLIRANVVDPGFVADCGPWLDATALWGQALVASLDGLAAAIAGDAAGASATHAHADELAAQAAAIRTIPGETKPEGPVRVGDGVLDDFIASADGLA